MNDAVREEIRKQVDAFRGGQVALEDFASELERLLYQLEGVSAELDGRFREVSNELEMIRFTKNPEGWRAAVEEVLTRLWTALDRVA
ncbi:hypothetical protein ABZ783_30520 [Micromonospora sp. NPDC047738]|uniref:hypothetical protein n=1 Tax=Micromonospora sp. NPDC047738 TaxID=3155741 RepID=UPI0033E3C062